MDRRAWAATGLLGLVAVVFAGAAVAGGQKLTDANEREDAAQAQLAAVEADATDTEAEATAQQDTLEDVETELTELRRYFTADAVAALNQVQSQMAEGGCDQARTATRNGDDLPAAHAVMDYAVATITQDYPALKGLDDRWGDLLVLAPLEEEIATCAADEQASIDAEQEAARAAKEEAARVAEEERFCDEPLFVTGYCPTQAEIDFENQAEAICGPGTAPESPWYDFCHGLGPPP